MLHPCSALREMRKRREKRRRREEEAKIRTEGLEKTKAEDLPLAPIKPCAKNGVIEKRQKILNSEEDANFLRQKKNLDDNRPDIVHEKLEDKKYIEGHEERNKACLEIKIDEMKHDGEQREGESIGEFEKSRNHLVERLDGTMNKYELPGIPLLTHNRNPQPRITFVLEKASLVPAYVGRRYQILNPDEHADFMRKKKMNPYDYRPDIVHQALIRIMNSRLCMTGRVQAIYIRTDQGVLIQVQPNARIPRTLKRFCSMMSELLQKFSIKARGKGQKLLRLLQNPVTQHLPVNSRKIGFSFHSQKAVTLRDYVSSISSDVPLVFVVGAMAHGKIDGDYTDDFISASSLPLSAATCLRRIFMAMERKWKIH